MDSQEVMAAIEGILFLSGNPANINEIAKILGITNEQVLECAKQLEQNYAKSHHGLMISKVGEGLRLTTKPEIFPYIESMFKPKAKSGISKAALETLAIIMFKQPMTRNEVEMLRGVNVEAALSTLLEKNLIYEKGRLGVPGRPILYAVTEQCMDYFGIESISDVSV